MSHTMIEQYNSAQGEEDRQICEALRQEIDKGLPDAESRIWHAHPVWFLKGNPIVGYSKLKSGVRLMFWSGASFDEPALNLRGEKFKDASIVYRTAHDINSAEIARWLKKSREIQWDYANIVKRKGGLERLS